MSLKTTIVVPCYNEEARLALPRFADFASGHPSCRFLFVNDGSTDGTLAMLSEFCKARAESCDVLDLEQNQGKAGAVRMGMHTAMGQPDTALAAYWDADLATDLTVIPRFIEEFEQHPALEIAMGSRVRLLGRHIHRKPMRHILGRCFATAASLVLKLPVYDTQCGAKMFRAIADIRLLFEDPFQTRWIFDLEILAR